MPTKRTRRTRARQVDLSCIDKLRETIARGNPWMVSGERAFGRYDLYVLVRGIHYRQMCDIWKDENDSETREFLWSELGAEILAEHVQRQPGTRPWAWWIYNAPETRRPIGRECLDPTHDDDCDRSHDQDGRLPAFQDPKLPEHFKKNYFGKPNCSDGFRYESERDFLERLGLLTDAEKARLKAEDFE
jgi:hypothetical protein